MRDQDTAKAGVQRRLIRRGFVAGVAALIAAGVAKVSNPSVAEAADGNNLVIGQNNASTSSTNLTRTNAGQSASGFKVTNNNGAALEGTSTNGPGVYGWSHNTYGVIAQTLGTNEALVATSAGGISFRADTTNGYGVFGTSTTGIAGYFTTTGGGYAIRTDGRVLIFGDFSATGMKSAVVPFEDGVHRRLYCMESPEPYFEDIGIDRIVNGAGRVRLDNDFRKLIRSDNYIVFLTPMGDCKGLYVSDQTPVGFEVRELDGGTSSVRFTYRVAAKRKDVEGPRLQRVPIEKAPKVKDIKEIIRSVGGPMPR